MTAPRDDQLCQYLRVLAGGGPESAFLELRYRIAEQTLAARFFPVGEVASLAEAIRTRAAATDVYVGCAPRVRRSGSKRDIAEVWVLWAECDGAAAARAARSFEPAPAIVIASGTGENVHAYWPLTAPLSPREAEHANLRLARALKADEACYDCARILRPPGTWNHKHAPATPVMTLSLDSNVRYEAQMVVARTPTVTDERARRRWQDRPRRNDRGDPLLQIPPAVYVGRLLGVEARPGRKVHCPFHADAHPSLHVYPTAERGWSCFSCGRGGSIYDLAAPLFGMGTRGADFVELRRVLDQHLGREAERAGMRLGRGLRPLA